ncbi:MAG TPA: CDP-alcohol phosphatidyltransferase family protein [Polyangiaceae bacterium]|nr:CDP-alcohol phosphatidyltransferase family protein [Polyangiaceae bacterium]
MGQYRLKHAFLVPSLVSWLRLPLAALFVLNAENAQAALALLVVAAGTDMVDGWYARRFQQATATGAVIDGLTDKAFMATVVITLVAHQNVSVLGALQLATRELGEFPLVIWWALHRDRRQARAEDPKANVVGKLCTIFQFAAVAGALASASWTSLALGASALMGCVAAWRYWQRELGNR